MICKASRVVSGDDWAPQVQLMAKNTATGFVEPWSIPPTATVRGALISTDHSQVIFGPSTASLVHTDDDLPNGIVVIEFTAVDTSAATVAGLAVFEVEVEDISIGKLTWFSDVTVVLGLIA